MAQDRQTRQLQLKEALSAAAAKTTQLEGERSEELAAENLTAQQRLDILRKYKPLLEQAKRDEIAAQRKALLEEEDALYADALETATEQHLSLENVNKDHANRMAAINRQYGDGEKKEGQDLSSYLLGLTKEHQRGADHRDPPARPGDAGPGPAKPQAAAGREPAGGQPRAPPSWKPGAPRNWALKDLTGAERLAILKKYQPLLAQAKREEIAAQRKALVEEEDAAYQEAITAATERGDGLELVNRDHAAKMAAINRQYGDGAKKDGQELTAYLLNLTKETNAAQTTLNRQHDQAALALDRQSRKLQLEEALRAAGDRTTQLENEQRDELETEDLTGAQRLAIIQKYKPLLEQAKRDEVAAQRKALVEEQAVTYQDAIDTANRQGDSLELVNKDHAANMAAIDRQYGDGVKTQGPGPDRLPVWSATGPAQGQSNRHQRNAQRQPRRCREADRRRHDRAGRACRVRSGRACGRCSRAARLLRLPGAGGCRAVKQLDAAIKRLTTWGRKPAAPPRTWW